MKILFIPVSIVTGLIAGIVARKAFERVWSVIDEEEPPAPDHRVDAVRRNSSSRWRSRARSSGSRKAIADHGARKAFASSHRPLAGRGTRRPRFTEKSRAGPDRRRRARGQLAATARSSRTCGAPSPRSRAAPRPRSAADRLVLGAVENVTVRAHPRAAFLPLKARQPRFGRGDLLPAGRRRRTRQSPFRRRSHRRTLQMSVSPIPYSGSRSNSAGTSSNGSEAGQSCSACQKALPGPA